MNAKEARHRTGTTASRFNASPLVRKFASTIVGAAKGLPILDVACGSGRNAIVFASRGCQVICADIDLSQLEKQFHDAPISELSSRLRLKKIDLLHERWPFERQALGAIIDVDFLIPTLFPKFAYSLMPGGYLLIETVSGRGGNYLQLPAAGTISSALQHQFTFELYNERRVAPIDFNAVTVKLLAKRLGDSGR